MTYIIKILNNISKTNLETREKRKYNRNDKNVNPTVKFYEYVYIATKFQDIVFSTSLACNNMRINQTEC